MTSHDPDIAALAKRLGLRGLRYRSFVPTPLPAAPLPAAEPEHLPEPEQAMEPMAPGPAAPVPLPPTPAWAEPPAAAWPVPMPAAAPMAAPMVPPLMMAPPPAPSPSFPLLGAALTAAGQRGAPIPDAVPDAARPFAALRFAVSGSDSAQGS